MYRNIIMGQVSPNPEERTTNKCYGEFIKVKYNVSNQCIRKETK
jgi:hypothetical protein